jgi:hypothetical protein
MTWEEMLALGTRVALAAAPVFEALGWPPMDMDIVGNQVDMTLVFALRAYKEADAQIPPDVLADVLDFRRLMDRDDPVLWELDDALPEGALTA